jgi:hypothetical protein
MKPVVALVPALNEGDRIGLTVEALRSLPAVSEVTVIDDGSTDDTAAVARAAGACCLSLPRNLGKGDALNAGVGLVRERIIDGHVGVPHTLLLADGDLAASAVELQRLLDAIDRDGADMAIADLPPQAGAGGFGFARGLAAAGVKHFTGIAMREPLSGQRALRWIVLPAIVPFAPNFGVEVAMTLAAAAAKLDVIEVEVPLTHAATGRDLAGALHRASQARSVATELIAHAHRSMRLRRARSQAM